MLFNILAISALLSAASATPVVARQAFPPLGPLYTWKVDKMIIRNDNVVGYNFDISGPSINATADSPEIPSFSASCIDAGGVNGGSAPCMIQDFLEERGTRNVSAELLKPENLAGGFAIQVTYQFVDRKDPKLAWNYTGISREDVSKIESFEIPTLSFTTVHLDLP
ncbi:hypothetical protein HYFRA_00000994 [Hymenoscyphus fraxineus]|uniref:AA1-like domain-containing protein n=1 Tax=Hymenoscyphus fraxineus TaxID=746836 RepID=A0A9N9KRN2_9HELO|nr:hypothetical protein HYFRA_00000994 [Hymenoscyphus fraxineus]